VRGGVSLSSHKGCGLGWSNAPNFFDFLTSKWHFWCSLHCVFSVLLDVGIALFIQSIQLLWNERDTPPCTSPFAARSLRLGTWAPSR